MDKEQIMIDGVDVRNCKGIDLSLSPLVKCKSLKFRTSDGGIAGIWCSDHTNCYYKQLARKTQECERVLEAHKILSDEYKRVSSNLCEDNKRLEQECEELKKANQHIDANRQCKGSKLKRIEELISACEAGYADEFIQKIYGIIQEPEPTINDYSITDRYRKALEEIEECINNLKKQDILTFPDFSLQENCKVIMRQCNEGYRQILGIINKAKEKE